MLSLLKSMATGVFGKQKIGLNQQGHVNFSSLARSSLVQPDPTQTEPNPNQTNDKFESQ